MTAQVDSELMNIFGFSADDLETNRQGKITSRQKYLFQRRVDADRISLFSGVLITPLLLVGVVLCTGSTVNLALSNPVFIAFSLFIFVLAVGSRAVRLGQSASELRNPIVCSAQGQMQVYRLRGIRTEQTSLEISNLRLGIQPHIYMQLRELLEQVDRMHQYQVYYTQHSKTILSIEAEG